MRAILPENLIKLAELCRPLYLVGGSVRDFLCGYPLPENADWDICSPLAEEKILAAAKRCGFSARSVYKNTGTVKLTDKEGRGYEFTRFRSDKYVRGVHTPAEIIFTDDMETDAKRRDFTANAVYYDIAEGALRDPLGGIADIKKKILRTVAPADKVFGEDGLRLMRLARFAAQLGFTPDGEALCGAKKHCALIDDIAPERVFAELKLILSSDKKHNLKEAPYRGLSVLNKTGVLAHILPELAMGDGMRQRPDFHDHDVLEHSLRCCAYAPEEIRFAALLHDVGKPFCMARDGNFYAHAEEGERMAREILSRLKAPAKLISETARLVRLHMRDLDGKMKKNKVRREMIENYDLLERLLTLKQADYTACKDDFSPAPAVVKWRAILADMKREGVPIRLSELAVNGAELQKAGVKPERTGQALKELLFHCAENGARNNKTYLLRRAAKLYTKEET